MEEAEIEADPFQAVNPSILEGSDGSELIAPIKTDLSADALHRLREEQKVTYGSRRPLVKWWLAESEEDEAMAKNGREL